MILPSALLLAAVLQATSVSAAPARRGFPNQKAKWGVAWPKNDNPLDINNFLGHNGWFYNWESSGQPTPSNGMPFVPMLHTLSAQWGQWFTNDVLNNQNNFPAKTVMMFNEPDNSNTYVSPSDACGSWAQYFAPLKSNGWTVIGPALANPSSDWYQQFKSTCADVESQIDFGNLHYYQTDPNAVISSATAWNSQFGKPVYITEVACWTFGGTQCGGESDAQSFLTTIGTWAASTEWVNGIAPFGFFEPSASDSDRGGVGAFDALANDDGSPSALYQAWESTGTNV